MDNTTDVAIAVQKYVVKELRKLPYISSVTLIGKKPTEGRAIERINDLDNIIIVDGSMTENRYNTIKNIFESTKEMGNANVDVLYAIADGPVKPVSEKDNEVFSHVILHTEDTYKNSPLELVKNSWQYELPFFGKPVREVDSIKGVTKEMLLDSILGVGHLPAWVKKNQSACLGWRKTDEGMNMELYSLKFTEVDERLELYIYSILRCASNTLRWITGNNQIGIGENMIPMFEKYCADFKHKDFPREAYTDKRLMRNRQLVLSETFAKTYQQRTMDFLKGLGEYISKIS